MAVVTPPPVPPVVASPHRHEASPARAVTRSVALDVAAGRTGVWVLSQRTRVVETVLTDAGAELVRIDPGTGRTLRRIRLDLAADGLVQGADGRLWVRGSRPVVVDPRTGAARPLGGRCVGAIAAARGGAWAWSPCTETLTLLRADGHAAGVDRRIAGRPVPALALNGDGLYVARAGAGAATTAGAWRPGGAGTLERRNPRTARLIARMRVGPWPDRIAVRGGSVWVLCSDGRLWRLDPWTLRVQARVRVSPSGPGYNRALAVGAGSAWVAPVWRDVFLARVDPRTVRVTYPSLRGTPAGMMPVAIAAGRRAVWMVLRSDGTGSAVCRLTPRDAVVERCFVRSR